MRWFASLLQGGARRAVDQVWNLSLGELRRINWRKPLAVFATEGTGFHLAITEDGRMGAVQAQQPMDFSADRDALKVQILRIRRL